MSNDFHEWKTGDNIQLSSNFKSTEFECPGSENHKISKDLVTKLQKLREEYGHSITITSGYRSEAHNKKVGGVKNSQHVRGLAADLTAKDLDKLHELCLKIFNAVGDGRKKGKFIHVDVRSLPEGAKGPITFGY